MDGQIDLDTASLSVSLSVCLFLCLSIYMDETQRPKPPLIFPSLPFPYIHTTTPPSRACVHPIHTRFFFVFAAKSPCYIYMEPAEPNKSSWMRLVTLVNVR